MIYIRGHQPFWNRLLLHRLKTSGLVFSLGTCGGTLEHLLDSSPVHQKFCWYSLKSETVLPNLLISTTNSKFNKNLSYTSTVLYPCQKEFFFFLFPSSRVNNSSTVFLSAVGQGIPGRVWWSRFCGERHSFINSNVQTGAHLAWQKPITEILVQKLPGKISCIISTYVTKQTALLIREGAALSPLSCFDSSMQKC